MKIPLAANFLLEFRHNNKIINQPVGVRKSFSGVAKGREFSSSSAVTMTTKDDQDEKDFNEDQEITTEAKIEEIPEITDNDQNKLTEKEGQLSRIETS